MYKKKVLEKLNDLKICSNETKLANVDNFGNCTVAKGTEDSYGLLKCLQSYCSALDAVIAELEALLKCTTELKTLQAVECVLRKNRLEDGTQLEHCDRVIPEEVKCPICFEIYAGEIWQCVNGHCVCGRCRSRLTACSECREDFQVAVRNRALESLVDGKLKVDCPNWEYGCRERLKCREVKTHFRTCQFGRKSVELLNVERDIMETERRIKTLEERVETLENNVKETGEKWSYASTHHENRLMMIQAKNEHQVLKKEMEKWNLHMKIKSLLYFNS